MDTKKLSKDKSVFQIRNHEKGMFTKKKEKDFISKPVLTTLHVHARRSYT